MIPTTPIIDPALSPDITQTNVTTTGESPAEALGNLYEEIRSENENKANTNN